MRKFSYAHCPSARPLEYFTITEMIKKNAEANPDLEIFIFRKMNGSRQMLTYKELFASAKRVAMYLVSKNVKRQDRIGLFGSNSLNRIIAEVGILLAGAVVLQLNIEFKDATDARNVLDLSDCSVVFVDPGENGAYQSLIDSLDSNIGADGQSHQKRMYIYLRSTKVSSLHDSLEDIVSDISYDTAVLPEVYPEDDAVVFLTSGSTGKPKMVVNGHFSFCSEAIAVSFIKKGVQYNDRPFAWSGGNSLYPAILSVPRVFTDSSLGTKGMTIFEIWNIMKDENIENAFLMLYHLHDMINYGGSLENDDFRLKSIRTSGQLVDNWYTQVVGRFCDELIVVYGSTETGDVAVKQSIKHGDLLGTGDVGTPVPGVEIRITHEKGHPTRVEESGEIQVRSRYLMKRYNSGVEMIANAFTTDTPAWFRTGDVGFITKDGNLIIQGRIKDNISRGGRKILPGAIDSVIKQLPGISDAMTIAVPDSRLYEEICVCYTTINGVNLSFETLKSYCEEKFVQNSASCDSGLMPKYFVMFGEFPIMSTGKPNKQEIKKEARRMLGLE